FQLFALLCSLARSACVIGPLEPFEPPPHCCALRAAAPPWSGSCFLLLPLAGLVETFWFILCLHRCGCTDATGRGRAGSANRSIARALRGKPRAPCRAFAREGRIPSPVLPSAPPTFDRSHRAPLRACRPRRNGGSAPPSAPPRPRPPGPA